MTELIIEVEGLPAPQGSKKAMKHKHADKIIMLESAGDRLKAWRQNVTLTTRNAANLHCWEVPRAAIVNIHFRLPRPKKHFGTGRNVGVLKDSAPVAHVIKPDADKLTRAVNDALTDAGVIQDDSTIVGLNVWKGYADVHPPGARISVMDFHHLAESA